MLRVSRPDVHATIVTGSLRRWRAAQSVLLLSLSVFGASRLGAVGHLSGVTVARPRTDHVHRRELPAEIRLGDVRTLRAYAVSGVRQIAVIVVDFSDQRFLPGWHTANNIVFSSFTYYFHQNSGGMFAPRVVFFHQGGSSTGPLTGAEVPFRMPQPMAYYGADTVQRHAQLIREALLAAGGAVARPAYDHVMVLHAGAGNESTDTDADIWSAYTIWGYPVVHGFDDGTIVPERQQGASGLGVVCHEYGHQIGLPDLYRTVVYQSSFSQHAVVGAWCLMDSGAWTGMPPGSHPVHLSAWCKLFMGWLSVRTYGASATGVSLASVERSREGIRIPVLSGTDPSKEYLLAEYRECSGFNVSLPGPGMLLWRVDDAVALSPERLAANSINGDPSHYGVDLIEADRMPVSNALPATPGNPFPGSTGAVTFFTEDYGITAFNGSPFPLKLLAITTAPASVSFDIELEFRVRDVPLHSFVVGNNVTEPGRLMLLGFNLVEQDTVKVGVFDVRGNRVVRFEGEFPAGPGQFMWFGTDEHGAVLPHGLYFVHFSTRRNQQTLRVILR